MVIAVDGPAGAGKSTVAKLLARTLGYLYIDTGAMYRALTLKALDTGVPIENEQALVSMAQATSIDLRPVVEGVLAVFLDGKEVTAAIRQPRVSARVSDVAKVAGVRAILVKLQRTLGASRDAVLDGRDIGTVVFPDAQRKFYIDAAFEERARRRHKELFAAGTQVTLDAVKADLSNRDTIDSTRACGPLKRAADAIYIDTTSLTIPQVVDAMRSHI